MANTNIDLQPTDVVRTPEESAGGGSGGLATIDDSDTSSTFSTSTALDIDDSDSIIITVVPPGGISAPPAAVAPDVSEEPTIERGKSQPSSLSSKRVRFRVESDPEVWHLICHRSGTARYTVLTVWYWQDDNLSDANPNSNERRSRGKSRPPSILRSETDTSSVRSQSRQSVHFPSLPPSRIIETVSRFVILDQSIGSHTLPRNRQAFPNLVMMRVFCLHEKVQMVGRVLMRPFAVSTTRKSVSIRKIWIPFWSLYDTCSLWIIEVSN